MAITEFEFVIDNLLVNNTNKGGGKYCSNEKVWIHPMGSSA
jgi:hypothetical protein